MTNEASGVHASSDRDPLRVRKPTVTYSDTYLHSDDSETESVGRVKSEVTLSDRDSDFRPNFGWSQSLKFRQSTSFDSDRYIKNPTSDLA